MILVTGATGCVGSNLTRELVQRGGRVAIFRRPDDSLHALADVQAQVEHRLGDVRDAEAVERAMSRVDQVYHVAGIVQPLNALHEQMMAVNVRGTENVARSARRRGARMVYTSSVAAVGCRLDGQPADETFRFNGFALGHSYMITKHLAEEAIAAEVERGLDAVIVNPSGVVAPGADLAYGWAALIRAVRAGRLPCVPPGGSGMTTRADVVEGHLRAMERGVRGERYILNSTNLTFRELCRRIAAVVGTRAPAWSCPAALIHAAGLCTSLWASVTGRTPDAALVVRENVPWFLRCFFYDAGKARRELGVLSTPLEDAIRETDEWAQARS